MEKTDLAQELVELFDIKKAKIRNLKNLNLQANEAQKDIRLLTLMFRDGIPSLEVSINPQEIIKWDADSQKLLYMNGKTVSVVEATPIETRIMIRPYLSEMVKMAKRLYV